MSSISLHGIISVVVLLYLGKAKGRLPDSKIFLCIKASVTDAAAVNPNGIKTLIVNGLIAFFIHGNPVFNNGPRSLPINLPDFII